MHWFNQESTHVSHRFRSKTTIYSTNGRIRLWASASTSSATVIKNCSLLVTRIGLYAREKIIHQIYQLINRINKVIRRLQIGSFNLGRCIRKMQTRFISILTQNQKQREKCVEDGEHLWNGRRMSATNTATMYSFGFYQMAYSDIIILIECRLLWKIRWK